VRRFASVLLLCAVASPVSVARAWVWPVDGPVLRPFSFDHAHPYAGGQHRGIDIGAPGGTEVVAPAKGVVSFAGTVPTGGKTVSIQTPLGYTATLVHLGSIEVRQGAAVAEGDVVGTVGPSGTPELSDPYLYFGVRLTADEQGYVDPLGLLPPRAAAAPPAAGEPQAVPATAAAPASAPTAAVSTPAPVVSAPPTEASAPEAGSPAVPSPAVEKADMAVTPSEPIVDTARAASDTLVPVAPRALSHAPSLTFRPSGSVRGRHAAGRSGVPVAARDVSMPHTAPRAQAGDVWARGERGESTVRAAAHGGALMWPAGLVVTCVALACAGAARRKRARIMSDVEPEPSFVEADATAQDPGGARLAVCVGQASPGPRRRVRGSGRHLRALPPLEGQRRPDGEWDRRAWDAGDGHGRSRRRLAA